MLILELWNALLFYAKDTILLLLGILGGAIVSLYFFRKGLARPELSYAVDHDRLIWTTEDVKSDLEAFYKGIKVNDPRKVTYCIWNSGNKIIEGSSIAKADPLRVGDDPSNILLVANITRESRKVINANIELNAPSESAIITFDFLEPKDGFVVECFYDKKSDTEKWREFFNIKGTIKEINSIIPRDYDFEVSAKENFKSNSITFAVAILSLAALIFQVYEIFSTDMPILIVPKILTGLLLLFSTFIATAILASGMNSTKVPASLAPEERNRPSSSELANTNKLIRMQMKTMEEQLHKAS